MERVDAAAVAQATEAAITECAVTLRPDYRRALEDAKAACTDARAKSVLASILENAAVGEADRVPICQDTGSVWVCLEVGPDASVPGDVFGRVNDAVAHAYEKGCLRMSLLHDALFDRTNTGNNTPAFCEVRFTEKPGVRLSVLLKGGGSDNASRVVMLPPGAGRTGVMEAVLACVREKAVNACPPLVVGVGVGATFDKVAGLAKHALLREIGSAPASEDAGLFEHELLEAINDLGIGPGGLGGAPTALAVHLETAPCHIAALPVAINMGCCAMRSKTVRLI